MIPRIILLVLVLHENVKWYKCIVFNGEIEEMVHPSSKNWEFNQSVLWSKDRKQSDDSGNSQNCFTGCNLFLSKFAILMLQISKPPTLATKSSHSD